MSEIDEEFPGKPVAQHDYSAWLLNTRRRFVFTREMRLHWDELRLGDWSQNLIRTNSGTLLKSRVTRLLESRPCVTTDVTADEKGRTPWLGSGMRPI